MSSSSRIQVAVDQFFARVRAMARGGDLDALIDEEIDCLERVLYEEAIREREEAAASPGAAFPPSGVSAVRQRATVEEGTARAQDSHKEGTGGV